MHILDYQSGIVSARLESSRRTLLQSVCFSLHEKESLAIIGETGSGKTMLALSIMGLLPANVHMENGRILFADRLLRRSKEAQQLLGVELVYIPQNGAEFLNPSRTIKQHLYDNLRKLGTPAGLLFQTAVQKLCTAGLNEPETIMEQYPFQLSGGMAQRVTIAISACSRAKLVIADEPTNGLDQAAKTQFLALLDTIFPEAAKLIITHDMQVAAMCQKIMVLCGGRMMEKGPAQKILEQPNHPYTKALLASLVKSGMQETPVLRHAGGDCPFYRRCPVATDVCSRSMERHASGETEWWCGREP